jgi:hypothetical protein
MSNALRTLPDYKRQLQLQELEAARDAGVDALVAVYHADHRELCAHERDWPFVVINLLEVIGASMGIAYPDHYKRLKIRQDVDLIVAECRDLLTHHGIRDDDARRSIKAMLEDQPLPLRVNDRPTSINRGNAPPHGYGRPVVRSPGSNCVRATTLHGQATCRAAGSPAPSGSSPFWPRA